MTGDILRNGSRRVAAVLPGIGLTALQKVFRDGHSSRRHTQDNGIRSPIGMSHGLSGGNKGKGMGSGHIVRKRKRFDLTDR
jgi:hypothetical protein